MLGSLTDDDRTFCIDAASRFNTGYCAPAQAGILLQSAKRFQGAVPLFVIPMDKRELIEMLYDWRARNVEMRARQVSSV